MSPHGISNHSGIFRAGSVSVTLRNQGPDAFKPELYGDKICIERKILKDGSGGYRVKACNGMIPTLYLLMNI
jgi:hypothetical protein